MDFTGRSFLRSSSTNTIPTWQETLDQTAGLNEVEAEIKVNGQVEAEVFIAPVLGGRTGLTLGTLTGDVNIDPFGGDYNVNINGSLELKIPSSGIGNNPTFEGASLLTLDAFTKEVMVTTAPAITEKAAPVQFSYATFPYFGLGGQGWGQAPIAPQVYSNTELWSVDNDSAVFITDGASNDWVMVNGRPSYIGTIGKRFRLVLSIGGEFGGSAGEALFVLFRNAEPYGVPNTMAAVVHALAYQKISLTNGFTINLEALIEPSLGEDFTVCVMTEDPDLLTIFTTNYIITEI